MGQLLKTQGFEALPKRLSLAGDGQPRAELAGAVRGPGCSPKRTREASGESPDPSSEFPDWPGQLPERSGDLLRRTGDSRDRLDQTWDVAREIRVKLRRPLGFGDCLNPT